jgi:hypothetical protein
MPQLMVSRYFESVNFRSDPQSHANTNRGRSKPWVNVTVCLFFGVDSHIHPCGGERWSALAEAGVQGVT